MPLLQANKPLAGLESLYAFTTIHKKTYELIVKLVNGSGKAKTKSIVINDVKKLGTNAALTVMKERAWKM